MSLWNDLGVISLFSFPLLIITSFIALLSSPGGSARRISKLFSEIFGIISIIIMIVMIYQIYFTPSNDYGVYIFGIFFIIALIISLILTILVFRLRES